MTFQLAKTLEGIEMYGPIYDLGSGWPDKIEEYRIDDVGNWFLNNMVDRINACCDTLLDDGDYDYISAQKCVVLIEMLDNLPNDFVPVMSVETIKVLKDYAQKAIDLNTGISIEM